MTRFLPRVVLTVAVGVGLLAGGVLFWKLRPAQKAWVESRIKLIDDFNDGAEPNLIGGESFTQAFASTRLLAAPLRITTPGDGELALGLTFEVPAGNSVAWGTGLNDLDISAARSLEFWLKTDHAPLPQLRVEVVDGFGAKAQSGPLRLQPGHRWQHVVLPAGAFKGVNFNRLSRFILRIGGAKTTVKGVLYLDDLAFVGPPSIFFRSLEDNLYGFPWRALTDARPLAKLPLPQMLRAIAGDTWGYFRDAVDSRHHLPLNYLQTQPTRVIGDYTSTTDIALYLIGVVSAHDLDLIDYASAVERVRQTLQQLQQLPKWNGFLYNYYSTTNLQVTRQYISSVDNGWLAAALVVIRQAFPELKTVASTLLQGMDFNAFYDPQNGQIRLGYEADEGRMAPYHYGLLATEARIISVVAIGKGDVPQEHWFRVYRTLPKEWTWQRQIPQGEYRTYRGHDVFQGYYTYSDSAGETPIVPSWGGSLFEFLMPTLVVDEQQLAPLGLGQNDQRAVDIHIRYALQERGYPVWGLSPCATPKDRHGGYSEFGVAGLGAKSYKDEAIVTPHVSFLALSFAPAAVEENLRQMLRRYELYGPYGFYDAVDVKTGDVVYRYLALDQGMSLIAINNYLNNGAIQRRFAADPVMKNVEWLLREERFFEK
ncbi:MAG: glucoamylase family protein [Candidatus Omnitrophota bacterium]|nr:glucoamylase family protein [Candidatus Omnitrophota bacterium]